MSQTVLHAITPFKESLVQGFLFPKHHKYWTIMETHLRDSAFAQSQGGLAIGQGAWGRIFSVLLVLATLRLTGTKHCACSLWAVPWPSVPLLPAGQEVDGSMLWVG